MSDLKNRAAVEALLKRASFHNAAELPSETGLAQQAVNEAGKLIWDAGWSVYEIDRVRRAVDPLVSTFDLVQAVFVAARAEVAELAPAEISFYDAAAFGIARKEDT